MDDNFVKILVQADFDRNKEQARIQQELNQMVGHISVTLKTDGKAALSAINKEKKARLDYAGWWEKTLDKIDAKKSKQAQAETKRQADALKATEQEKKARLDYAEWWQKTLQQIANRETKAQNDTIKNLENKLKSLYSLSRKYTKIESPTSDESQAYTGAIDKARVDYQTALNKATKAGLITADQRNKLDLQAVQHEREIYEIKQRQNVAADKKNRKEQEFLNITSKKTKANDDFTNWLKNNNKIYKKSAKEVRILQAQLANVSNADELKKWNQNLAEFKSRAVAAGESGKTLSRSFGDMAKKFGSWLSASRAIMFVVRSFKEMVNNVKELDAAMTELKKVTDATTSAYQMFLDGALDKAKKIGATVSDYINAASDFARLGYDMGQASDLAQTALIYKNVGDGIENIAESSESVISTMKAFSVEAKNSMTIVDKFNNVGNNFASSSGAIGVGLMKAGASLSAAGNTLEESIGMFIAMNEIIQDEDVSGTALKTIAARMTKTAVELDKMGIYSDGAAESVSKLRKEIKALSGVDIMLDDDTYKSTYDVLIELSTVWEDLSNKEQAGVRGLMAGTRQTSTFNALMKNMASGIKATETAMHSQGSAMAENEKYLDSISGKLEILEATYQSLSAHLINSNFVKGLVDKGAGVLEFLDQLIQDLGSIPALLASVSAGFSVLNKNAGLLTPIQFTQNEDGDWGLTTFFSGLKKVNQEFTILSKSKASEIISDFNKKTANGTINTEKWFEANKDLDAGMEKFLRTTKATDATVGNYETSIKKANVAIKSSGIAAKTAAVGMRVLQAAMNFGIMLVVSVAIEKAVELFDKLIVTQKEAIETANKLTSEYESTAATIKSNISTLSGLTDEFNKLSQGVDENGKNVGLTTEQYERYKSIVDQIVDISPEVVQGYNAEGEAIVSNNGLLQEAIRLQRELNEAKKQEYLDHGREVSEGAKGDIAKAQEEADAIFDSIENDMDGLLGYGGLIPVIEEVLGKSYSFMDGKFKIFNHQDEIIENFEEILRLGQEQEIIDETAAQSLRTQLGLYHLKNDEIDASIKKITNFLSLWSSSQEWYKDIDPSYFDEFSSSLATITSDTDLPIDEMQGLAKALGESFVAIQDNIPTKEIGDLQKQLKSGTISSEEYNERLNDHIKVIEDLAEIYKDSESEIANPALAKFLELIALGFANYANNLEDVKEELGDTGEEVEILHGKLSKIIKNDEFSKQISNWIKVLKDFRSSPEDVENAVDNMARALCVDTASITSNLDLISAYAAGNQKAFQKALNAQLKLFGIKPDTSGITGAIQALIDAAQEGNIEAKKYARTLAQLGAVTVSKHYEIGVGVVYEWDTASIDLSDPIVKDTKTSSGGSKKDKHVEAYEKEANNLKHRLEMNEISEEEYYENLKVLNDKYYKGKKKYLDKYQKFEEEYYKWRKQHAIDTIDNKIDYNTSIRDTFDEGSKLWEEYNKKIYNLQLKKQAEIIKNIQTLIDKGMDAESDEILELQQKWYDIEQWKREEAEKSAELRLSSLEDEISLYEQMRDLIKEGSAQWKYLTDQIESDNQALQDEILQQIQETIAEGEGASSESLNELYKQWYELEQRRREEQQKTLELQQDKLGRAHKSVVRHIDEEIDKLKEQKDLLSDEDVEGSYGQRIKLIQDQIDLLQKQNDEAKKANELEEARQELEDKRRQKTKYVYRQGEGFVYENDTEGIKEAEEKLADLELQQTIDELEDQISTLEDQLKAEEKAFDDQIDSLDDYKDQWEDILNSYEEAQDDLIATQILGADWEQSILEDRLTALSKFRDEYIGIQEEIAEIAEATIPTFDDLTPEAPAEPTLPPAPAPTPEPTPEPNEPPYTEYTVKRGDNLSKIARRHDTTVDKIMDANSFIKNKNRIRTGWTLRIPKYASGRLGGGAEVAVVDDNGKELIIRRPDRGRFTALENGDTVYPHDRTVNLWEWGGMTPENFMAQLLSAKALVGNVISKSAGGNGSNVVNVAKVEFPNATNSDEIQKALIELPNYFKQQSFKE